MIQRNDAAADPDLPCVSQGRRVVGRECRPSPQADSSFVEPFCGWGVLEKNSAAGIMQFNEDNKVEHDLDNDELQRLVSVLRANDRPMGGGCG